MFSMVRALWTDDSGATAVEYGMMVALIAVVIIAAVAALGRGLDEAFSDTAFCVAFKNC